MAQSVGNIYKQNRVVTASPKELVVMLYEGCIKFLRLAELGLQDNKMELVNKNLIKAQNIIEELRLTLNMEVESEVSNQLAALYEHFLEMLLQANIKKDSAKIVYVRNQMTELLSRNLVVSRKSKDFFHNYLR